MRRPTSTPKTWEKMIFWIFVVLAALQLVAIIVAIAMGGMATTLSV